MDTQTTPYNEPAFPVQDASKWQAHGMTLRDYCAARALPYVQGTEDFSLKQVCAVLDMQQADYEWSEHFPKFCARMAYKFADAMLAERAA